MKKKQIKTNFFLKCISVHFTFSYPKTGERNIMRQNSKFFFRVRELFNFHLLKHKMKALMKKNYNNKKKLGSWALHDDCHTIVVD